MRRMLARANSRSMGALRRLWESCETEIAVMSMWSRSMLPLDPEVGWWPVHTLKPGAIAESRIRVRLPDRAGNEDVAIHGRFHNVDLVRRHTNDRAWVVSKRGLEQLVPHKTEEAAEGIGQTIYLVHLLDLLVVFAGAHIIVVELVPVSDFGEQWTGEGSHRAQKQAIAYQNHGVGEC